MPRGETRLDESCCTGWLPGWLIFVWFREGERKRLYGSKKDREYRHFFIFVFWLRCHLDLYTVRRSRLRPRAFITWPLASRQTAAPTYTSGINNTLWVGTHRSICTAQKRFTVVFWKQHFRVLFLLSKKACLYEGADWPGSSVSQRVERDQL